MLAVTITSVAIVALFLAAMIVIGFGFYATGPNGGSINYLVGVAFFALASLISVKSHHHSVHVVGSITGALAFAVILGFRLRTWHFYGETKHKTL